MARIGWAECETTDLASFFGRAVYDVCDVGEINRTPARLVHDEGLECSHVTDIPRQVQGVQLAIIGDPSEWRGDVARPENLSELVQSDSECLNTPRIDLDANLPVAPPYTVTRDTG